MLILEAPNHQANTIYSTLLPLVGTQEDAMISVGSQLRKIKQGLDQLNLPNETHQRLMASIPRR